MPTTDFDDSAKTTSQKRTAKPFFDVEKDPVFQLPAMIDKKAYFVSYHGMVYPMDLSASPAEPAETWSILSDADKKEGWRPGGWQPVARYAPGRLIFVLMHQGGEWTQVGRPGGLGVRRQRSQAHRQDSDAVAVQCDQGQPG